MINSVDELLSDFHVGELCSISSRPGMGKTALMLTLAKELDNREENVIIFSLSSTKWALLDRLSRMNSSLKKLYITDDIKTLEGIVNYIDTNVSDGVVFIDYMELLCEDTINATADEMGRIVETFSNIAKSKGIRIVLLTQVSRRVEDRIDKRPRIEDLRNSQAIESYFDLMIMIYRVNYYEWNNSTDEAELLVRKNKGGEVGTIKAVFDRRKAEFAGLFA